MSSELSFASAPLDEYQQDALRARGKRLSRLRFVEKLIRFIEEEPASPEDSARLPELYASRDEAAKQLELTTDLLGEGNPDDIARLRSTIIGYTAMILARPEDEEAVHEVFDSTELIPAKIAKHLSHEIKQLHDAINSFFDEEDESAIPEGVHIPDEPSQVDTPSPADIANLIARRPIQPAPSSPNGKDSQNNETTDNCEVDSLPDNAEVLVLELLYRNGTRPTHIGVITQFVFKKEGAKKRVDSESFNKLMALLRELVARGDVKRLPGKQLYMSTLYCSPENRVEPNRSTPNPDKTLSRQLQDARIHRVSGPKSSTARSSNRRRRRVVDMSTTANQ